MLGYLFLDIICSLKLTVFFELRSRKTVCFSEQIKSADKYPSKFSRQIETIVSIPAIYFQFIYFHTVYTSNARLLNNSRFFSRVTRHTFFAVRSVDQVHDFISDATLWPVSAVVVLGITLQTKVRENVML